MPRVESLRVPKSLGQEAILLAKKLAIIDRNLKVNVKDGYVIIPLTRKLREEEIQTIKNQLRTINFSLDDFPPKKTSPKSLAEALNEHLPPNLLASLPKSLDVIGNVAILEVPPDLYSHKKLLGKAVLEVNKKVETVLAKASSVSGELRLRDFEVIAGTGKTETIHREHGCIYYVDPTKAYFSPRLSTEHWRVAQQVMEGEVVVDMFTGVGPFAIQIGKRRKNVIVYAIDLNPDAIEFLRKNISLNKVEGKVIPILGDARETVEKRLSGAADRVIMNLPGKALEFVDVACRALKPEGGVIHYYGFEEEPEALENAIEELKRVVLASGRSVEKVLDSRFVRPVAPREWQIALDVIIL